ncbi:MAG: hypothetical protein ACOCUU_01175 [Nanoarchaeota archaeon]
MNAPDIYIRQFYFHLNELNVKYSKENIENFFNKSSDALLSLIPYQIPKEQIQERKRELYDFIGSSLLSRISNHLIASDFSPMTLKLPESTSEMVSELEILIGSWDL